MSATPEDVQTLVEAALDTYEVTIDGELITREVEPATYEVEVPFRGEVILEEFISNYSLMMFNKEKYGELSLKGLRDGHLLLTARPN